MEDDAERRSCGTLPLCYPNLILLVTGRSTNLANKINATESTIPLIWTALAESSPGRQSWVYIPTATSPARRLKVSLVQIRVIIYLTNQDNGLTLSTS